MRVVLIVAVVLHVLMAWQLTMRDARPRGPIGYAKREPQVATLASRTMRWGGVLLLVFIVLHILHFTTGHRSGRRPTDRSPQARCLRQRRRELPHLVGGARSTSSR